MASAFQSALSNTSDHDGSVLLFPTHSILDSLPTNKETGLGDTVTQSTNAAVLREAQANCTGKRKAYTAFTPEQKATIGKYTSKHGNAAVVKKFKEDFEGGQLG